MYVYICIYIYIYVYIYIYIYIYICVCVYVCVCYSDSSYMQAGVWSVRKAINAVFLLPLYLGSNTV